MKKNEKLLIEYLEIEIIMKDGVWKGVVEWKIDEGKINRL